MVESPVYIVEDVKGKYIKIKVNYKDQYKSSYRWVEFSNVSKGDTLQLLN